MKVNMMRDRKNFFLNSILLSLVLCICVLTCSCTTEPTPDEDDAVAVDCQITILTEGGMPLSGVGVSVYRDNTKQELINFARTDKKGVVSFHSGAKKGHVAVLTDVPEGYTVDETYPIEQTEVQIQVSTYLKPNANIADCQFETGDIMVDFSMTATDGTKYVLSEVLKEKKAVVLNFWYTACQPCKAEFPHLQAAYDAFSDEILVLACDTAPIDDVKAISAFAADLNLTLPMIKCDAVWERAINLTGYPTTIVIDQYGMVSFMHTGTIPDTEVFKTIFAYYTADNYQQQVVDSVNDFAAME